ncbi:MAG: hypothetical protein IJA01_08275 [Firmicutes bacterium]|nr:hypothetical protein [Bacillota bacterium]
MLDRMRFEMYWSYYISIEEMLRKTSQYVSPSKENKNTYSDEFAKIILLSCSEIDSILKKLCELNGIICEEKKYNMNVYVDAIDKIRMVKELAYSPELYTSVNEKALIVFPYQNLNKNKAYAGLEWWRDYQKIKHNRIENAECGNLYNAVSSVAAHLILVRALIEFLDEYSGKEYVQENKWSDYMIPCV